jgi:hypothetical protein
LAFIFIPNEVGDTVATLCAHPARDNLDAMREYSGDPIGSPPSLELAGLLVIRPMTDRPWRGRLDVARRVRIAPRTGLGLSPTEGRIMAPTWLTVVAWIYLSVCFACAGAITYDIFVNHRRQPMGVMNAVFPITALYFGPLALAFYWRWGRTAARNTVAPAAMSMAPAPQRAMRSPGDDMPAHGGQYAQRDPAGEGVPDGAGESAHPSGPGRPWWAMMATEVSHCGSGCVLGDVISEFVIFALALTVAGATLGAEYIGDYVLALAFGILFQYFAIAPMRGLGLKDGLKAAAKADVISLTAFEIGLFGWMAVMTFVLFPAPHNLMPSTAAFWFLMQIGMIIGYFTSWPANVWLVNRGIKIAM